MTEEEFNALEVYLNLLGDLVENQEKGVDSALRITTSPGMLVDKYEPIEKLGLFQGSENVLIIDDGLYVNIDTILESRTYEIEVMDK